MASRPFHPHRATATRRVYFNVKLFLPGGICTRNMFSMLCSFESVIVCRKRYKVIKEGEQRIVFSSTDDQCFSANYIG